MEPTAQPTTPLIQKPQRVRWVIVGAILVGIVLLLFFLFKLSLISQTPPPKQESKIQTFTGLELAQKILAFAENTKTSDGNYPLNVICEKGKGCSANDDLLEGPPPLLTIAYLHLYRATGDKEYLRIADEAIEEDITRCTDSIMDHCYHNVLLLTLFYHYTNDQKYLNLAPKLRAAMDDIAGKLTDEIGGLKRLTFAGHLMDYYVAVKEEKYKAAAFRHFEIAKNDTRSPVIYNISGYGVRETDCQSLLTTVDFYRLLKDDQYLNEANELIAKAQFHQNAASFQKSFMFAPCIEAYMNLFEFTGDTKYNEGAMDLMRAAIKNFMDHPKNNFYTSDYGITNSKDLTKNTKWLSTNFWVMANLAKMKDVSFQL